MAGHSHWAGIKRQKEVTDKKRGVVFSKLLAAITAAGRREPNLDFNPRLRTMVLKAKDANVPKENIARALERAIDPNATCEELVFEAYGPGGVAILIEAVSTNRNRAVQEIKKILGDHKGKWAESGSVRWAFEESAEGPRATFPVALNEKDAQDLGGLVEALEANEDVQRVSTNAQ